MPLITEPYNRARAVEYANYWAYRRNPDFYDFENLGGDCTNFVSQCIYYANGVMNFTPELGWYYIDLNDRAPAWTGVDFFYNFLTTNTGQGPFGADTQVQNMQPGDIVQMQINQDRFHHSAIITAIEGTRPDVSNILIAAHSRDVNCKPINTYNYQQIRFLHITGVRRETTQQQNAPLDAQNPMDLIGTDTQSATPAVG